MGNFERKRQMILNAKSTADAPVHVLEHSYILRSDVIFFDPRTSSIEMQEVQIVFCSSDFFQSYSDCSQIMHILLKISAVQDLMLCFLHFQIYELVLQM